MTTSNLQFVQSDDGAFNFDTGVLKGILRNDGKSIGLVPVTYVETGMELTGGEGLFNHYRVFTRGKRYGYGARRWDSTAILHDEGSVEVIWDVTDERPFELRGTYTLSAPNTVDLVTTVRADANLEAYEVFLAAYYQPPFIDSRIWATNDPRGGHSEGFVSADKELGVWLAFPRDDAGADVINDGRWDLEPHPLDWTMMPNYALPLAIRRDPVSKLTVVVLTERKDCFGIFTPYGEENHYSNYLSLWGHNIDAGEQLSTRSRLIVLPDPSEADILEHAKAFMSESS